VLVSCLPCCSIRNIKAIYSSETSVDFQRIIRHYIPEYRVLYEFCSELLQDSWAEDALHITNSWLQRPVHADSSLADFSTLKMEAIYSSETLVHKRYTRRHIPEDGILHSHSRENLKSYMNLFRLWDALIGLTLYASHLKMIENLIQRCAFFLSVTIFLGTRRGNAK
jgi:hypothetical protein